MTIIKLICIIMEVMLIPATAIILTIASAYGDLRKEGRRKLEHLRDMSKFDEIRDKMAQATLDEITFYLVGVFGVFAIIDNLVNNIL